MFRASKSHVTFPVLGKGATGVLAVAPIFPPFGRGLRASQFFHNIKPMALGKQQAAYGIFKDSRKVSDTLLMASHVVP